MRDIILQSLGSGRPPRPNAESARPTVPDASYAADRLSRAWHDAGEFGLDEAVLLRQLIRWSPGSSLYVGNIDGHVSGCVARAGIKVSGGALMASPFAPRWLGEDVACDDAPAWRAVDERFGGETYLSALNLSKWQSAAQKEAVWSALNLAAGETKTIVLPTGAGKSLCFQMLPLFVDGLTVVVVPTVALAMDQQRRAAKLLRNVPGANPLFYSSDGDKSVIDEIKIQRTRMVFTSPEACVAGRLRPILDQAADNGWFRTLVLDECHLIETWGAQFRVEFQVLSAVRSEWATRSKGNLRTLLLSATMSPDCRRLLSELFSAPGKGSEFVCQRFRPEIRHFNREFNTQAEQRTAVIEALLHLPRPAIVYVTEPDAADDLAAVLRTEGFRRVASFHGDTPRDERKRLLAAWHEDQLDVMVATSAFGVGVDKPDIRTVVHACFPENLDRYYQEVGRAGRDGWSATCLLLVAAQDRRVAHGLGVRLLRADSIQQRWNALYRAAQPVDGYVYRLPVDSRRIELLGTRTYEKNILWNKRLLVQLHRARLLVLKKLVFERSSESDEAEEWADVEIRFPPDAQDLGERIAEIRQNELDQFANGEAEIDTVLRRERCFARSVQKVYGITSDQRSCGGCPACRRQERKPEPCPRLALPEHPRGTGEGVMVANWPDPMLQTSSFARLADDLISTGYLRRFVVPADRFDAVLEIFRSAFTASFPHLYRIDPFTLENAASLPAEERFAFLHLGEMSGLAVERCLGGNVVHLRCGFAPATDVDGRDLYVTARARLYHSPEAWAQTRQ